MKHEHHLKNKHGVCTTCAMIKAREYAEDKIEYMGYRPKSQEKAHRMQEIMWEEFYKLTTPYGPGT